MTRKVVLRDLQPDPRNARTHPERNIDLIATSLQEVGAGRSVLVDENLRLIAGHGVVEAAGQAGIEQVIVVPSDGKSIIAVQRVDLTEEQKARLALFDNRTTDLSSWDPGSLLSLYQEGLTDGMFTQGELDLLLAPAQEEVSGGAGGDDFDETPYAGQTRVSEGDVWQIGPHRLFCGDSRQSKSYIAVMATATAPPERAHLLWTDPPYGVSYDRPQGARPMPHRPTPRYKTAVQNDDLRGPSLRAFLVGAWRAAQPYLAPQACLYIFHGDGPYGTRYEFEGSLQDVGWHLAATLVWIKQTAGYGYADYRAQHEPIIYGWTDRTGPRGDGVEPRGEHYFSGDHTQTTVWQVDRDPNTEYLHPTQKPVELALRAIRNSTRRGEVVLDPFCGGGTAMIGCHRAGRRARLIDSDPDYCDVVLRRAEAEGIEPIRKVGSQ